MESIVDVWFSLTKFGLETQPLCEKDSLYYAHIMAVYRVRSNTALSQDCLRKLRYREKKRRISSELERQNVEVKEEDDQSFEYPIYLVTASIAN